LHTRSGKIPALMHCKVIAQGLSKNPADSLIHFRAAELLFEQRSYPSSANEFRAAHEGGPHPTENVQFRDLNHSRKSRRSHVLYQGFVSGHGFSRAANDQKKIGL
jgi:hypothetical protein